MEKAGQLDVAGFGAAMGVTDGVTSLSFDNGDEWSFDGEEVEGETLDCAKTVEDSSNSYMGVLFDVHNTSESAVEPVHPPSSPPPLIQVSWCLLLERAVGPLS